MNHLNWQSTKIFALDGAHSPDLYRAFIVLFWQPPGKETAQQFYQFC